MEMSHVSIMKKWTITERDGNIPCKYYGNKISQIEIHVSIMEKDYVYFPYFLIYSKIFYII